MKRRALQTVSRIESVQSTATRRAHQQATVEQELAGEQLQAARDALKRHRQRQENGNGGHPVRKSATAFILEQSRRSNEDRTEAFLVREVNRWRRQLRRVEEWLEHLRETWQRHEATRQTAERRVQEANRQWKATLDKRRADEVDDRFADRNHRKPR